MKRVWNFRIASVKTGILSGKNLFGPYGLPAFFPRSGRVGQLARISITLLTALCGLQLSQAQIRIMPMGDSITHGWSYDAEFGAPSNPPQASYRLPLWVILNTKGYNVDFVGPQTGAWHGIVPLAGYGDQQHAGYAGAVADWFLSDAMENELDPPSARTITRGAQPDIVLLMIGLNDLGWQGGASAVGQTIDEIGQIIDQIREERPNVVILLASVTPNNYVEFETGYTAYPQLNARIPSLAAEKNQANSPVVFVDMQTRLNQLDNNDQWFFHQQDELHLNDFGDAEIAQRWFEKLEPFLGEPTASIQSPANATSYNTGDIIPISVTAADPDTPNANLDALTITINGRPGQTFVAPPYQLNYPVNTPGPLTINAIARDATGLQRHATPVTINIGPGTQTGSAFTGMSAWWRADAGVILNGDDVTQWQDQSGNDNHLSAGANDAPTLDPTLFNGRPGIRFDGDDSLLSWTGMPRDDYTKVAVIRLNQTGPNNIIGSATDPYGAHTLWYADDNTPELYHHQNFGLDPARDFENARFVQSDLPTPLDTTTILVGTYDRSAGRGRLYQDGTQTAVGDTDAHNTSWNIQLGAYTSQFFLDGAIAEILIYPRLLTGAERRTLEEHLQAKYKSDNRPPQLNPLPPINVHPGESFQFTATATDPDPGQNLTFTLNAVGLTGATLDPQSGLFTWAATDPGTYSAIITATDNGTPTAASEQPLSITVATPIQITTVGPNTIAWDAIPNRTYVVEAANDLTTPDWTPVTTHTPQTENAVLTLNATFDFRLLRICVQ